MVTAGAWLAAGAALASVYVALGRRLQGQAERTWWAGGLAVAALVYVGFAVARGAPPLAVAFEAGGAALFTAVGVAGLRGRRGWLAAGWLLHPAWDLLHAPGGLALAPAWYVWACLGFDVVVGLALLRET